MTLFNDKGNWLTKLRKSNRNWHTLIISIAVLLYIRGIFGLMDSYLFPENKMWSYVVSIVLGLLILFLNNNRLEEIEKQ